MTTHNNQFPLNAPVANPLFYRSYSRPDSMGNYESWEQVVNRSVSGFQKVANLTTEQVYRMRTAFLTHSVMPSGRWLWCGGTEWSDKPENVYGGYNCSATEIDTLETFGYLMDFAMQGCGTGAGLEQKFISKLPVVINKLNVIVDEYPFETINDEITHIQYSFNENKVTIDVGDSRQGWVYSYLELLRLATFEGETKRTTELNVLVRIGNVRPAGKRLQGFGGVSNPLKLKFLYKKIADILNGALDRQLSAEECCLLLDEAALVVVAGNVRRSAGIRQFDSFSPLLKANLWTQDETGRWKIDPKRDALRMSNHTRVFHNKPTLNECIDAVRSQYYNGEGAIQWAGEAIARGNADILDTPWKKRKFIKEYDKSSANGIDYLASLSDYGTSRNELEHRINRYLLNPCVTGDTWVHTEHGARQVKEIVGEQLSLYVNGELFSTTRGGFWCTGVKQVFKVVTKEGYELRLTDNHKLLKVTTQTQYKQYSEWTELKDLVPGDNILLNNHRDIRPWGGDGNFEEGWLIGSLIGDGSLNSNKNGNTALLRYWGDSKEVMATFAVSLLKNTIGIQSTKPSGHYHKQLNHHVVSSAKLSNLANRYNICKENKTPGDEVEKSSYDFYRGFLQGLFDADGSVQGTQNKGISVRLAQSNLGTLKVVQRMLSRLGIISTIYQNRRVAGYRDLPDANRNLASYFCKSQHELVITNDNVYYYKQVVDFREPDKAKRLTELLDSYKRKFNRERFSVKIDSIIPDGAEPVFDCTVPGVNRFDANGIVAHNCGEIIGTNFFCNLSEIHLNTIDPLNLEKQNEAFRVGALSVACLLHQRFTIGRYQYSRNIDPIVGVSITGLFDFFVNLFGVDWLHWWSKGRPYEYDGEFTDRDKEIAKLLDIEETFIELQGFYGKGDFFVIVEEFYLKLWKSIVFKEVDDYCKLNDLKTPNRCTTVQPAGSKSLLTNASPGWHPPKAAYYIRRITYAKNDPGALACLGMGYSIVPSQSDKDDEGNLLSDPYHPNCTEWLVEIPVKTVWADLPGVEEIDISKFSVEAQFDFYMQVQQHYTTHNTSATFEIREHEIESFGNRIYNAIQDDEGYVSGAILARFDNLETFPRLPFEPISKQTYENLLASVEKAKTSDNFQSVLERHTTASGVIGDVAPSGCDSDACTLPVKK